MAHMSKRMLLKRAICFEGLALGKVQGATLVWPCCFKYWWNNRESPAWVKDARVWRLVRHQNTAQWFTILWDRIVHVCKVIPETLVLPFVVMVVRETVKMWSRYKVVCQEHVLACVWLANSADCQMKPHYVPTKVERLFTRDRFSEKHTYGWFCF